MTKPPASWLDFDGRAVGTQLRELIRALCGFADPREATGGQVEVQIETPDNQEQQETKDG